MDMNRCEPKTHGAFDNDTFSLSLLHLGQSSRWEALAVGLHLSVSYLTSLIPSKQPELYPEGPRVPSLTSASSPPPPPTTTTTLHDPSPFTLSLLPILISNLEHPEPRVRTLVAKCVCAHSHLDTLERTSQRQQLYDVISTSLYRHLETGRVHEVGALDDTTGWRALETSLHALAAFLDGTTFCPPENEESSFSSLEILARTLFPERAPIEETSKLLQALERCCTIHVNRHVRAAALSAMEKLVSSPPLPPTILISPPLFAILSNVLETSLADNWSQVRMAASVLCRSLFLCLEQQNDDSSTPEETDYKKLFFPKLLPRMCLNRFYLAQGVKLYSQETWKRVVKEEGMKEVACHAGAVVRYYVKMCDADNHVVREAACQAVAELAQKLGTHPDYAPFLEPHVPNLLQALLVCFYDESWPVRDEACLACGTFVKAYPQQCHPELSQLYSLWISHLTDPIWSVRQDAAAALGDALTAYPELIPKMLNEMEKLVPSAKEQPGMTKEEYLAIQNDEKRHTGSQLYSCGSLAPKLQKGSRAGGCSDCVVNRPKQPWEATDGCIYLLKELCVLQVLEEEVLLNLAKRMADVCRVRHFPQADELRSTLWKCLPAMAHGLGKKRFKRVYLELFLELLMQNAESRSASQLSIHAAQCCLVELAEFVGVGILRGRLEEESQKRVLDECLERKGGGGGMGMGEGVSPFGPPGGPVAAETLGRFP